MCFWIPFQVTLYEKAMRLPLSLPVGPRILASEPQPPIWNVFAEAPSALLENLKGQSLIRFRNTTISVSQFIWTPSKFCWNYLQLIRRCNNVRMVQLRENIVHVVQKPSAFQGSRYQSPELITFKISGNYCLLDRRTYFICLLRIYGCLIAKSACKPHENIT